MISSYEAFVTLPSARRATAETLTRLAAAQPDQAVLFHCTAGKDRTGWMAALTYHILEVDPDEVMADYLASGPIVAAMLEPMREGIEARGIDLTALAPAMTVEPEYLDTSFEVMVREFGTLASYLTDGLGLPEDFQDRMAASLLT
jgi:protein-tyrosine phosphatase